jgi:hypothetical protein
MSTALALRRVAMRKLMRPRAAERKRRLNNKAVLDAEARGEGTAYLIRQTATYVLLPRVTDPPRPLSWLERLWP